MNSAPIVPDITLERYRLGELPADEDRQLAARLAADADLRNRLAALEASDHEILSELPAAVLAGDIASRLRNHTPVAAPGMSWMRWALPAAGALTLAVFIVRPLALGPSTPAPVAAADAERVKGLDSALAIYRRTESGSELLADGDRARTGDLLRIGYKVAAPGYGIILSIDGRGLVTRHLPAEGGRAVPLANGDTVLLDSSYELDDAPKWERFYLVTSQSPFDIEPVLTALRRTAPLDGSPTLTLDPALGHVTFVLQKDARP
ncbi:MAG: ActD-like protein [Vicinamibacterales bacterium]